MENIIYAATIVNAKDAEDGETPKKIVLTREVNGLAIFETGYEGTVLVSWWETYEQNAAIEAAVAHAEQKKSQRKAA